MNGKYVLLVHPDAMKNLIEVYGDELPDRPYEGEFTVLESFPIDIDDSHNKNPGNSLNYLSMRGRW